MRRGEDLGKYRLRRRIATGTYATVWEAWDMVMDIPVALKIPKDDGDRRLFLDEVRIQLTLEHPNVLPVLNADYIDDVLVVASPLGRESLREQIQRGVDAETALFYAGQLLAGLAEAHDHDVVHCDVKPENLILFGDGRVRLGDFGLAKFTHDGISEGTSGTVGYLAPEQAHGHPSKASDVFAAALVIHELLTGCLLLWPFDRPFTGHETLLERAPQVVAVLDKALVVDERERYPDAGEMLREFSKVLDSNHRISA